MTEHPDYLAVVREFIADVQAAYGSQGQSNEEIEETLTAEWSDLAKTWRKALAAVKRLEAPYVEGDRLPIMINGAEQDTIIAALRCYQANMQFDASDADLMAIATNSDAHPALTAEEIDTLIEERINA